MTTRLADSIPTTRRSNSGSHRGDRSRRKKLRLAAGSAAAAAMYLGVSAPAHGEIIHQQTPISIGIFPGGFRSWDVDGDGIRDFALSVSSSSYNLGLSEGGAFVNLVSNNENGIEGFSPVAGQFAVGATLPSGYFFGRSNFGRGMMRLTYVSTGSGSSTTAFELGPDALGWDSPTQYVGFRFLDRSGGSVDFGYGWASITLDTSQGRLTINEWAYEATGGPIPLGAVPEPSAGSLALLACGAAGLRRWRRNRDLA